MKTVECSKCQQKLFTDDLLQHICKKYAVCMNIRNICRKNKGKEFYQCRLCDGYFKTQPGIAEHIKAHITFESSICMQCQEVFFDLSLYEAHQLKHQTASTETPQEKPEVDSLELFYRIDKTIHDDCFDFSCVNLPVNFKFDYELELMAFNKEILKNK